jgi:Zn-dependent protease
VAVCLRAGDLVTGPGLFPATFPGFAPSTYWLLGALAALGLFGSVLFHELSHSLVARARGLSVQGITLFIFGGVSNLGGEARAPGDEFLVSVVGPLSSLLLAGIWWALQQALAPGDTPAGALLGYLAVVNAGLAVFNLVRGFPLDGGRVLRWSSPRSRSASSSSSTPCAAVSERCWSPTATVGSWD